MRTDLSGLRCLVMGGSGFIGTNLCRRLVACGASVRSFARNVPTFENGPCETLLQVEWLYGTLSDPGFVRRSLRDIDIVFHLVSTTLPATSNMDAQFDLSSNVLPTLQFLDIAKTCNIQKVIFVSSGGTVYGIPERVPIPENHPTNPICAHGIHKLAIEKYLHLSYHLWNLDYRIVRLSNPYGIGQSTSRPQGVIAHFIHKFLTHQPLQIWGKGTTVRDYVYIDDAIRACLLLVRHQGPSRVFNIGSGIGYSLLELVSMIEHLAGKPVDVELLEARRMDVPINVLDVSRAASELRWRPHVDIEAGLQRMFEPAANKQATLTLNTDCAAVQE